MTDSNETIMYENGRDAGYSEGFEDGVTAFSKYLKKNSCFYDLDNYHSFSAIDIDNLDDLVKEFLDNR